MKEILLNGEAYLFSTSSACGPRDENQDSYGWLYRAKGEKSASIENIQFCDDNELFLVVVCDGMGGLPHGRQASSYAVYKLLSAVSKASFHSMDDFFGFCKMTLSDIEEALKILYPGSGSTIAMIVFLDGETATFHLGDSRVYYRCDDGWHRTFDHAPADERFRNGQISEDEVNADPEKNVIHRYLGGGFAFQLDMSLLPDIDKAVVCSDGAYAYMKSDEFRMLIGSNDDAAGMVNRCIAGGSRDNTTLVCISRRKSTLNL